MEYSNEEINKILTQYKKKREREITNYHTNLKNNEEWQHKNKERALNYYHKNKEKKKTSYQNDKDFINARAMLRYYKRINKVQSFVDKYPDKVEILSKRGVVVIEDENLQPENNILENMK